MTTINTNSPNRSYTITGVNNDVTYKVRVAAVNSIGAGPFTEYVFATPSLFAVDNDFYNVELLLNMDQTSNSDNYYGNSSLILGTPGLENTDDPYSVQTKLLLHGDGIAIVDSSLNPKSITRANSPYTVSDNRFGTGSIRFTGNNYLTMGSSNDFSVGTGDFTVELFIKFKSINTHNPICNSTNDINSADNGKWYINYMPSAGLYLGRHSGGGSATTSWSAAVDVWYHLAFVRESGTIRIFIDGVEQTVTDATSFNNVNFNQSGFLVGKVTTLSGLDAQIDEFRFTKGVARNITVPTVAYPNPTSPFKDLSSNSKNVIVIGQPLISSYSDAPSAAPTNIVASQQSGGPLRLDWDFAFPLLVDYVVQYSEDGGINWNTVNDGVSTNNNATINLADGFYIFRIAATNSFGQGPWSETKDVTLPIPATVEYLVVAGGGGGGNDMGGGGGAGGLITNVSGATSGGGSTAEPTLYLEGNTNTLNIVVGAGGSGASSGSGGAGTNGGNSTVFASNNNDSYLNNVSLLMHMDQYSSSFADSSLRTKNIIANGSATQSTAQSRWGGKSALLGGGSGNFLSVTNSSDFDFGSDDFVIEFWLYFTQSGTQFQLFARSGNQSGPLTPLFIEKTENDTIGMSWTSNGSNWQVSGAGVAGGSTVLATSTWHHIALSRNSGTFRIYVNGTLDFTDSSSSAALQTGGDGPSIGVWTKYANNNGPFYLDDFRITKGFDRGYNGSTITVPTSPFPNAERIVMAVGGGYGASKHDNNSWNASNGGSGGGGSGGRQSSSNTGGLPGNGTAKQGFNGASSGYQWYPGGGGGAGGAGIGGEYQRGHGGPGVLSSILGTLYYWAGGGGASGYSTTGGDGGVGGGGGGAVGSTTGGAGINNGSAGGGGSPYSQTNTPGGNAGANTGGGGGGGSHYYYNNYGGSGGSGAVILRSLAIAASTTGSPTVSTNGPYNIYMFTGTGSITFPSTTPTAPPPPKNIMSIQNTQGDLILSWDALASRYNVTDYVVEYRSSSGSSWTTVSDGVSSSTGATISGLALGDYVVRVAAVNSVGQGPWRAKLITVFSSEGSGIPINLQYLVVGGGGGGNTAGGGGAGGVLNSTVTTSGNIVISVGSGGSVGVNGENSNLLVNGSNITAIGGGYGGPIVDAYVTDIARGGDGGSGGGVGSGWAGSYSRRGYGTVGQGYDGGSYSGGASYNGAGGGGAGGVGTNGSYYSSGSGGVGRSFNISGTSTYYAGGGGGGARSLAWGPWDGNGRIGGQGGGGNGDVYSEEGYPYTGTSSSRTGSAGTPNTGGGGGGGGGYAGGSGIVIIRAPRPAVIATGSPTVTIVDNDVVYTFTGSGSLIF